MILRLTFRGGPIDLRRTGMAPGAKLSSELMRNGGTKDFDCSFRDCLSIEPDARYRSPPRERPHATDPSRRESVRQVVLEKTGAVPVTARFLPSRPCPYRT